MYQCRKRLIVTKVKHQCLIILIQIQREVGQGSLIPGTMEKKVEVEMKGTSCW